MSTPLGRLSEDELRDHGAWLRRVARGLVASDSDADDLAQDVWTELARGSGPIAHLRALSARVARRLAGHRRAAESARTRRETAAARPEALPGPHELEDTLEIQRLLLEELTALDEIHRTPLLLHFHEGHSAAEIARRRGVPASTVRSQLARAQTELRARMDRRHGGRRELWVALLVRLERPEVSAVAAAAAGGLFMTTLGKSVLVAAALGAMVVAWRVVRPLEERGHPKLADAGLPPQVRPPTLAAEAALAPAEPEQASAGRSAAVVAAPRDSQQTPDVTVRVLDEVGGAALSAFELRLANDVAELELSTDVAGRATIPAAWFEGAFRLHLRGDDERAFEDEPRELSPADRPADGVELELRCATGPTYTLLFDAPPPESELVASLSAGSGPPERAWFTARVRRDGARRWTRFAPTREARGGLGDGPWTLTVLDEAGLWRAHGPVRAIAGEQHEPVVLTSESCGALRVAFECDAAPQADDFNIALWRMVDGRAVEPRHDWLRPTSRGHLFRHLLPGEYRVSLGSPVHQAAGERVQVVAGATADVHLTLSARSDVAALRVVITSESGQLDVSLVGANARELATNAWKHGRWSGEGTTTRRVLLFEGLSLGDHEVSLSGLATLGTLQAAPGRSAVARPGGADLVFTFLDADAPPMRTGRVRVLTREGAPIEEGGVTTYFDGWGSFHHRSDARGETQLESILEGVRFDLLVLADGFRPQYLRDLALPWDGEVREVRLEPGWGAWLDVVLAHAGERGPDTLVPRRAAGASVYLDGEPAGRLDERGQMLLQGHLAPARIEIRYPGHHVAYGDIDPASGAPTPHAVAGLWVVLEAD